ncbi:putative OsmC-like protein [Planktotalea frisia]|jgi:putative redox protein|uniref:OsmC-like protein n=1 Tax=Planktotalea frisia TaxID=696762 RepID=A0A1L9NSX9_9RHOB|nr:OsmC family protein [Planktotalea frisia]MDB9707479.1 OsmC family protein [Planktotalea frisia]OJI92359.1 OsmC-like protein [Planktotalea frisia]PZX33265.1 putative OsmC-like protein [Planktotalea frisia]
MAIKMKTVVTYRAKAECPTHSRTEIPVRDLNVVIDEPIERDGTNLGPTPTEAAMTALIACTNVIGHKCAHRLGVALGEVTIDADCKFDRRGVMMQEEIDVPFPEITLNVNCKTDASQDALTKVGVETAKFCAIAKLFTSAGTDLTVNWIKIY